MLAQDALFVSGGNTANMLAIWRAHGFDEIIREAWEQGIVLAGSSAGMICWFEAGVTDSFGPQLEGMRDGLGFLPGSACPHYDGEERRRPVYHGSSRTASRRASPPTTRSACTTSAPSFERPSPSARARTRTASSPGTRPRSSPRLLEKE